jgi:hypothetical protein
MFTEEWRNEDGGKREGERKGEEGGEESGKRREESGEKKEREVEGKEGTRTFVFFPLFFIIIILLLLIVFFFSSFSLLQSSFWFHHHSPLLVLHSLPSSLLFSNLALILSSPSPLFSILHFGKQQETVICDSSLSLFSCLLLFLTLVYSSFLFFFLFIFFQSERGGSIVAEYSDAVGDCG